MKCTLLTFPVAYFSNKNKRDHWNNRKKRFYDQIDLQILILHWQLSLGIQAQTAFKQPFALIFNHPIIFLISDKKPEMFLDSRIQLESFKLGSYS